MKTISKMIDELSQGNMGVFVALIAIANDNENIIARLHSMNPPQGSELWVDFTSRRDDRSDYGFRDYMREIILEISLKVVKNLRIALLKGEKPTAISTENWDWLLSEKESILANTVDFETHTVSVTPNYNNGGAMKICAGKGDIFLHGITVSMLT